MTALTLGQAPDGLTIVLTPEPFTATITAAKDGVPWSWPALTTVVLTIVGQVFTIDYPGLIAGPDVTFTLTATQVAAVDDNARAHITVTYPSGVPFRWVSGRVTRRS